MAGLVTTQGHATHRMCSLEGPSRTPYVSLALRRRPERVFKYNVAHEGGSPAKSIATFAHSTNLRLAAAMSSALGGNTPIESGAGRWR